MILPSIPKAATFSNYLFFLDKELTVSASPVCHMYGFHHTVFWH